MIDEAAHLRVFALRVFPYHHQINLLVLTKREGRLHPFKKLRRTNVGVLVKGAPDGQQQPVQRHMIGNLRVPHGPQQNGL